MKMFSGLSRLKRLLTKMLEDSKTFSKLLVKNLMPKYSLSRSLIRFEKKGIISRGIMICNLMGCIEVSK
jgi:hypothetical protein